MATNRKKYGNNNSVLWMHPPVRVTGKWMKLAIWYKRTPVLKHIDPLGIMIAILAIILAVIFPQGGVSAGTRSQTRNWKSWANRATKKYSIICKAGIMPSCAPQTGRNC